MPLFPSLPWMRSAPTTSIRLRDPLASSLGLTDPDGTVTVTVVEVARAVGRLDPVVTRTFTALADALRTLYRGSIPVRGEVHADVGAPESDPVAAVVGRVLVAVLAATPEEAPGRAGRLRFVPEQAAGKVRLVRADRRDAATFSLPRPVAGPSDLPQLLERASRGRTSPSERAALAQAMGGEDGQGPPVVTVLGVSQEAQAAVVESLLDELLRHGIRAAAIRHTEVGRPLDAPGSETHRYSTHGAVAVVAVGPEGTSLVRAEQDELPLTAALALLPPDIQLVVCDGFMDARRPTVAVCSDGATAAEDRLAEARLLTLVAPRLLATVGASSCSDVAPDFDRAQTTALAEHLIARLELSHGNGRHR